MNSLGMYAQNNNTMLSSHISSLMDPCIFSGLIFDCLFTIVSSAQCLADRKHSDTDPD
jgi:hypothetical protein